MEQEPQGTGEWLELLRTNWEKRARSPHRDFYVDSRPDYDDPEVWDRYARASTELVLTGLEAERLARMEVLDIGCGVGRLVPFLAPRVAGYTGVDIAPGMVEEARRRHGDRPACRFLLGKGADLPRQARDRRYDLAFSLAVLIHNPRPVIAGIVRSAYAQLAPGGELRFQFRADPGDPRGLENPAQVEVSRAESSRVVSRVTPEQLSLIDDHYYMGDLFGHDELASFLAGLVPGEVQLVRLELPSIFAVVRRVER